MTSATDSYSTATPRTDALAERLDREGLMHWSAKALDFARELEKELSQYGPKTPQWISVDDRLPDSDGWLTVWVVDSDGHVFASEYWSDEKEFWPPNGKGEYWAEKEYNVTHWMPVEIPAPPERTHATNERIDAEPPQPSLYDRKREETLRLAREVLSCAIPTGEGRQGILWAKRFANELLSASSETVPTGRYECIVNSPAQPSAPYTGCIGDVTKQAAPSAKLPSMPTEEMADTVRGVLQIIRNQNGATFAQVREHCELRGDDTGQWPLWVQDAEGYVTEQGAAMMIYEIMDDYRYRTSASTDGGTNNG